MKDNFVIKIEREVGEVFKKNKLTNDEAFIILSIMKSKVMKERLENLL